MKRKPVKSSDRLMLKKKRRRSIDPATRLLVLQILTGLGVIIFLVVLVAAVWHGSRIAALTIDTVAVEGGQTVSHQEIKNVVAGTLEGSYLGLVPRRFAWTYPEQEILENISSISRVKNPRIELVSGTELFVRVYEYLPFALWCSREEESKCFFVDKEGVAFASAPALTGGSMYRFYTLDKEPEIGKTLKNKNDLTEIVRMADVLENDFNLPVNKIEIDLMEDVYFGVVGGGEIRATAKESADKLLENLALVLSTDDFSDLKPGEFLYIDLRFGNKVFVNDVVDDVSTTTDDVLSEDNISSEEISVFSTVIEEIADEVVENEEGILVNEEQVALDTSTTTQEVE